MEQREADLLGVEDVLATLGERPDSLWCETPVAGLQFYAYDQVDDLTGEVLRPQPWERVQLVRQPENPKDRNAVQVLSSTTGSTSSDTSLARSRRRSHRPWMLAAT